MSAFISVRGSSGVHLVREEDSGAAYKVSDWREVSDDVFARDPTKNCKVMAFSPEGDLFAWSDGGRVRAAAFDGAAWAPRLELDHSRVSFMAFSPLGRLLATWDVLSTKKGQEAPHNLKLWDVKTGDMVASFTQKKSAGWCPQWSKEEQICCVRSTNNEAFFYRDNDFSTVDKRLSLPKMDSFSLSPGNAKNFHVACFVPGQKGGPGFGKIFTYPNFHPEKDVVASKSFFQSDRMDVEWSSCGRMALMLTQSEVDKTGGSYYGKQQLHFANAANGETAMVQLAKDGPIYSVRWSPAEPEFCVVYGYMPAKATLYSSKCEKVFDYGTGPRNTVIFNPQGNLLLLGGFGNLRGAIEVWAVKEKKRVSEFEATDSTDIRWSPGDGQRILTSTCAPRLRQGNGYKIWHYTGSLFCEKPISDPSEELWEVQWQESPREKAPPFQVQYRKVEGIAPKQPQASKVAYRPPRVREKPGMATFTKLLVGEDEPAESMKKKDGEVLSKSAAKNKKRREAAKKKKEEEMFSEPAAVANAQEQRVSQARPVAPGVPPGSLSDKDKKVRKLTEKLTQIQKLKEQQQEGKQLELNQLEKIKKETEIAEELRQLQLS